MRWLMSTILVGFAVLIEGCNLAPLPYSGEYADNPREIILASHVMDACNDFGITVEVVYSDSPPEVCGANYPGLDPDKKYKAAAWVASYSPPTVAVWPDAPHIWSPDGMVFAARHECCHIHLEHRQSTPENEAAADRCVDREWGEMSISNIVDAMSVPLSPRALEVVAMSDEEYEALFED